MIALRDIAPLRRRAPQRTCVACRQVVDQATLLRLVAVDGKVVVDPARRLPGRGAYVHRDEACLRRAAAGVGRALEAVTSAADLAALVANSSDPVSFSLCA